MLDPEIIFFDLETTVPNKPGQRFHVLEFGAVTVRSRNLAEIDSYCTLIKPRDITCVTKRSSRCNGITREMIAQAPLFEEVADKIYSVLHGKIWAGHNIQRFDCVRIKEAFADIDRPVPVSAGIIDSLGLLTEKFGRRAGNMKMASLAAYFGLGQQMHRSLEDVRMNLEVLKHCATVLLLESSLPPSLSNIGQCNPSSSSSNITTRSRSLMAQDHAAEIKAAAGKSMISREETSCRKSPPSTSSTAQHRASPYARDSLGKMTAARISNVICNASKSRTLNNLLKHSQSLIR